MTERPKVRKQLKRIASGLLDASVARHFHAASNAKAKAAYHAIVTQDPSRTLSASAKKHIAQYSREVFGSGRFAPWLEVYTAFRGKFIEGWIPTNYFAKVLVPGWLRYDHIAAKILARRILGTDQIPDVAYHFNGFWLDRDHQDIEYSDLKDRIFAGCDAVFVKLDRGARGDGVFKIKRADFDPDRLSRWGDFVVQSPIAQHQFFDRFTSDSVATLRITTVKPPGLRAENKASYLRLGRRGAEFIRSNAHVRVPIVDDQGTLGERGADASWASVMAHPDSNAPFAGEVLPGYRSAVSMCETLHDQSPVSVLIGWDIAIDRDGIPQLMEWNQGRAAIGFSEASVGPSFKNLGWEDAWKRQHRAER